MILRRFLARLIAGCWFSHDQLLNGREVRVGDEIPRMVNYCPSCRLTYPILASEMITQGSASQQVQDLGAVKTKAKKIMERTSATGAAGVSVSVRAFPATARRERVK